MDQASLKKLYAWFDQLIDLSPEDEAKQLHALRQHREPLVLHPECLLASARKNTNTTAAFGIDDLVSAAEITQSSDSMADNLDQLAHELQLDPISGVHRVGHFLLVRCLSVSKLGLTYHARDTVLDRDVVLLLAMPRWRSIPELKRRLIESARIVAQLFHPNVASILGTMDIDGQFITLRQWIPGVNLQEALAGKKDVELQEAIELASGVCLGLQALHQNNVLHGDLKPANIILRDQTNVPVITDFGTSLWLGSPQDASWKGGTPGYIAPEILDGTGFTKSADLYSLGVVLYQLLTARSIENDAVPEASIRWNNIDSNKSTNSKLRFKRLVDKLLSEHPTERPASVEAVLAELALIQADLEQNCKVTQSGSSLVANRIESHSSPKSQIRRRDWMRTTLESTVVGSVALGLGFFGTRNLIAEPSIRSAFVPGIDTKYHIYFPWDRSPGTVDQVRSVTFPAANAAGDSDFVGVVPKFAGRWTHLDTEVIQLPSFQPKANLVMFGMRFETDPQDCSVRLSYRYRGDSRWISILDTKNTFGGLYARHFQLSVPNSNLRPSGLLQFRVSIHCRGAIDPDSNVAPLSVCVHQVGTDRAMVQLWLWDRLENPASGNGDVDA